MLRAAFALIVVLTLESTAHARCRMQSPEQRYREAAAVFLGVASDPRQVEGSDPRVLRVEGCSDNLLPQGAYWLYRVTKREQRVTFTNGQLLP